MRDELAPGAVCLAAVGLTAYQNGGVLPTEWGWSAAGLLLVTAAGLGFRRRIELSRLQWGVLAGLASFLLWIALSISWSQSVPRTVHELERAVVYLAALAALFVLGSRRSPPYVLGGVLAAVVVAALVAIWDEVTSPDDALPLAGSLPSWNALGLLMAGGIILALGIATAPLPRLVRLAAAGSVALPAAVLYLTHSRGAFLALGAGLLAFAFLHPLLAGRPRRVAALALVVAAVAAVGVGVVRTGGPDAFVDRVYDSIRSPVAPQGRPSERLLTLSSNARLDYWQVAWGQFREHPWLGSGAGTFVLFWNRDRETIYNAYDTHNLYLETLAELGPLGLLLLLGTLALPFLALRSASRGPLLAAAVGAYVAFLVHAGVDWDWEVPAVTLAGVSCAAAIVIAAPDARRPLSSRGRVIALGAVVVLLGFTLVTYLGNATIQAGWNAKEQGDFDRAEARARTAGRWNPWSSEPWILRGEAQLDSGDRQGARASFRTGLRKDPRQWRLWYNLALVTAGAEREHAIAEAARLNQYNGDVRALQGK